MIRGNKDLCGLGWSTEFLTNSGYISNSTFWGHFGKNGFFGRQEWSKFPILGK